MRRFPTTFVLVFVAVLGLVFGLRLFLPSETQRYEQVKSVKNQRSELHFGQVITHDKGPIAREEWRLDNVNGASEATYTAENRNGSRVAKFTEPIAGYDVTFAFEKLVQDGIWELKSRPLRGTTGEVYIVSVAQVAGDRSGTHRFSFADPHYLATTAGREYTIHLDKNKPVPDLVTLKSSAVADTRYQKMVDDFAAFGPPRFKKTVAAAREKLLKS